MIARLALAASLALATAAVAAPRPAPVDQAAVLEGMPRSLSDYGFFLDGPDRPAETLIPYALRNPLFSDYAEKHRFIHLPDGARLTVGADGRVDFPVGTALIKSFGYDGEGGTLDVIETRVLLRREDGWLALPYVWNEDHSDAALKVAGTRIPVAFTDPSGEAHRISYAVPNKNQCKQCHSRNGVIAPIGPVWQEMVFPRGGDRERVAERTSFPSNTLIPSARWDDPDAPIAARAGSYLRANCAHCHSREGAASNSGLYYDEALGPYAVSGWRKRPVAAGRASGGFEYVVDPGKPSQSILIHRMKSVDPGIAMPEIGRATVHKEGVAVVEEWIRSETDR